MRQSMGGVLLSQVFLSVFVLAGPSFQASIRSMLLGSVDRKQGTLAPLLAHWCAGGKVPNCPNRNFHRGNGAQVLLHCDGEALFGNSRAKSSLFLGGWVRLLFSGGVLARGSLDGGWACSG